MHSHEPALRTRRSSIRNNVAVFSAFIAAMVGAVFLPISDEVLGVVMTALGFVPLSMFIRGRPLFDFPKLHPVLQFIMGIVLVCVLILPLLVIFGLAFQASGRFDIGD